MVLRIGLLFGCVFFVDFGAVAFGCCCWFDLYVYDFTLVGLAGFGLWVWVVCVVCSWVGCFGVSDDCWVWEQVVWWLSRSLCLDWLLWVVLWMLGCLGGYYVGFAMRVCLHCFSGFGDDFGLVLSVFPDCVYLRSSWGAVV